MEFGSLIDEPTVATSSSKEINAADWIAAQSRYSHELEFAQKNSGAIAARHRLEAEPARVSARGTEAGKQLLLLWTAIDAMPVTPENSEVARIRERAFQSLVKVYGDDPYLLTSIVLGNEPESTAAAMRFIQDPRFANDRVGTAATARHVRYLLLKSMGDSILDASAKSALDHSKEKESSIDSSASDSAPSDRTEAKPTEAPK